LAIIGMILFITSQYAYKNERQFFWKVQKQIYHALIILMRAIHLTCHTTALQFTILQINRYHQEK